MEKNQFFIDIDAIFNQVKEIIYTFLPKLAMAIIVFFVGFIIAKIIKALMTRFINRLERMVPNKTIQQKIKQIVTDPTTKVISNLIYWIIIVLFLTAATEIVGLPIISSWLGGFVNYLPNLLLAILIIFSGIVVGRLLRDIVITTVTKIGITFGEVLGKFTYYAVIIITILLAITQIGVNLAILTDIIHIVLGAILFGAALAFGFGAKTSISNILACYYLQNRYKIGETIKIENTEGQIIEFTSTSIIIASDIGHITIPAKKFSEESSVLINKDT